MGSKAHRVSPCMTRMQTCLMCWSLGSLPWKKGKTQKNVAEKRECQGIFGDLKVHFLLFGWTQFQFGGAFIAGDCSAVPLRSWKRDSLFFHLFKNWYFWATNHFESQNANIRMAAASELNSQQNNILKTSQPMQINVFTAAAHYEGSLFYFSLFFVLCCFFSLKFK